LYASGDAFRYAHAAAAVVPDDVVFRASAGAESFKADDVFWLLFAVDGYDGAVFPSVEDAVDAGAYGDGRFHGVWSSFVVGGLADDCSGDQSEGGDKNRHAQEEHERFGDLPFVVVVPDPATGAVVGFDVVDVECLAACVLDVCRFHVVGASVWLMLAFVVWLVKDF
jgi:hypothetical protein